MRYGNFLDELRTDLVGESGVDTKNNENLELMRRCMHLVRVSITANTPELNEQEPGVELSEDLEITEAIAKDALREIEADAREARAGYSFMQLLNQNEVLSYIELLDAFSMFKDDPDMVQKLQNFVSSSDYLRKISVSSPLYILVQCVLRGSTNYTEIMEQEIQDNQERVIAIPQTDDIRRIMTKFTELLRSCLPSQ